MLYCFYVKKLTKREQIQKEKSFRNFKKSVDTTKHRWYTKGTLRKVLTN